MGLSGRTFFLVVPLVTDSRQLQVILRSRNGIDIGTKMYKKDN